jgi:hypothetical protein
VEIIQKIEVYESPGGVEGHKRIRELENLYISTGYPKCIWVNPDPDPLGFWVLGVHAEN